MSSNFLNNVCQTWYEFALLFCITASESISKQVVVCIIVLEIILPHIDYCIMVTEIIWIYLVSFLHNCIKNHICMLIVCINMSEIIWFHIVCLCILVSDTKWMHMMFCTLVSKRWIRMYPDIIVSKIIIIHFVFRIILPETIWTHSGYCMNVLDIEWIHILFFNICAKIHSMNSVCLHNCVAKTYEFVWFVYIRDINHMISYGCLLNGDRNFYDFK